jgi:hypothetical protein
MAFNPYVNVYDAGIYGYNKPPLYPAPYPPLYYPPYLGPGGWYGQYGHHHGHHHGHYDYNPGGHNHHGYHQGWKKREDELAQVSRSKGAAKKKKTQRGRKK